MTTSDDPEVQAQLDRLRGLYQQVGESEEVGETAIAGIIETGGDVANRLRVTADAVAALWNITEESN